MPISNGRVYVYALTISPNAPDGTMRVAVIGYKERNARLDACNRFRHAGWDLQPEDLELEREIVMRSHATVYDTVDINPGSVGPLPKIEPPDMKRKPSPKW